MAEFETISLPLQYEHESILTGPEEIAARKAAIEEDSFPFEEFYDLAELESWRKELNRPLYHIHKWWARRLGSVFRAILIGSLSPAGNNPKFNFYRPIRFPNKIIFDPFMGSGTTLGEALKLGCRAIGRDINPVACFAVKNALSSHARQEIIAEYNSIKQDVSDNIHHFYEATLPNGERTQCLYYFWVKVLNCPACGNAVDLFDSYMFARHANPSRHPFVRAICPNCNRILRIRHDATEAVCHACTFRFEPKKGPARGAKAVCRHCQHLFSIKDAASRAAHPLNHRLYAKLVLKTSGEKQYLEADKFDQDLYAEATKRLSERGRDFLKGQLRPGYNTKQVINYGYRYWHEMFNDRQLLCLGMLADRIRCIGDEQLRELFACLFSGVLEFNNMFASYKGEGTGAVRHMFAHHILKPERMPLEANPWGTTKSSGSFSTLFHSRILRMLDYCENPFELVVASKNGRLTGKKIFGLSDPIAHEVAETYRAFDGQKRLYLSCGDSGSTDLSSRSVDAVVTDPPFFDNVHYSELADFFYVWQKHILGSSETSQQTTRSDREVQHTKADVFVSRLKGVMEECNRILKPSGLLVFTYHHSRTEGWRSILDAIIGAGFVIVATHPIKAELSIAMPKNQAKAPINLDIIVVCRRRTEARSLYPLPQKAWICAIDNAKDQIGRIRNVGRQLSRNDIRVIIMAQIVRFLSGVSDSEDAQEFLDDRGRDIENTIDEFELNHTDSLVSR